MKALTLTQPLAGATCERGDNWSFHCCASCFDNARKALSFAFALLAEIRREHSSITFNRAQPKYADAADLSPCPL